MALNLARGIQQSVVVHPTDDSEKLLTITVKESIPGRVMLTFNGSDFAVIRGEIFGTKANFELASEGDR